MYLCRLSYLEVWVRKQGEEQDLETFARVTLGSLQESVNAIPWSKANKIDRSDDDRLIPFTNGSWLWSVTLEAFIRDFIKFRTLQFYNTTSISGQHSYTTCNVSSEHLYIPFYRTNIRKFSSTIIGHFWNDLPLSIRSRLNNKTI